MGRRDADVKTIITCLTLTPDVAQEAVGEGAQLIVSHHPVLFRGAKTITDSTSEGLTLLQLIEHGIAVYSHHTSFDSALLGVNQQLANGFGLVDVAPLRPSENAVIGGGRM